MEGNAHKYVAKGGSRDLFCRRAPHGARGLKLRGSAVWQPGSESRPAWGAWIETCRYANVVFELMSRPAWGAWIETYSFFAAS